MDKPVQIVVAVRIMWTLLVLNGLLIFGPALLSIFFPTVKGTLSVFGLLVAALVVVLVTSVIRSASSARKWARVVYAVIASVAISISLGAMLRSRVGPIDMFLPLVSIAAYGTILVLLFHPASNSWYKDYGANAR